MITTDQFVWLHLPKTGGTSTARLFRSLNIDGISVDPDHVDAKHDSIETRTCNLNPSQLGKKTLITSRRLSSWLLSDWHHKTKKIGLSLPFEPVKCGLFFSLRLGGIWVSADYWIQYFNARTCTHVIRLEHLEEDSNKLVRPLLPPGTPKLTFPSQNINLYEKSIEYYFGARDLKRIHMNNPAWSEWEQEIYGNPSKINPITRINAKISALMLSRQS